MDKIGQYLLDRLRNLKPSILSDKPHFDFINTHYFWIIGLSIFCSVIIYASGKNELAYIDALFFATGANTQAGLNTVDVNKLNTFQQVVIYLTTLLTNPITINSFVVLLRLYWFNKKFQRMVRDALQRRGTMTRSKSQSRQCGDEAEKGVNGRNITVMHDAKKSRITNDGLVLDGEDQAKEGPDRERRVREMRFPEIRFADTVRRSDGVGQETIKPPAAAAAPVPVPVPVLVAVSVPASVPATRTEEEHIAILERQRKGDDEILRIPGPRDAERGVRPKRIEEGDAEEAEVDGYGQSRVPTDRRQAITIEEPDRRLLRPTWLGSKAGKAEEADKADKADQADQAEKSEEPEKPEKPEKPDDETGSDPSPSAPQRRSTLGNVRNAFSRDKDAAPYLSWEPTLGRNSNFFGMTEEQREELGGIEYRSLKTLAMILTGYFWGFSTLAVIGLLPWIRAQDRWGQIVDDAGQSRTWWAFFTANSAFMDLGFTLTADSMNSFNTAVWPLLLMSFLIIIGNTAFPIMLRFSIWLVSLLTAEDSALYEELRFLLDHPRRCFTLLFPSHATWWLFFILIGLNGIDLIFFIVLDLGNKPAPTPVADLPAGIKILDGFFQAASTRTAGFSCVDLSKLHPGVQVSYMIMMYISVFPIAISVRRTNVYEERSIGVYNTLEDEAGEKTGEMSYVGQHLRNQLSFDLWYIAVGFFILSISEGERLQRGDLSMFAVLFEIVSAYGTVGMSLGYPDTSTSLCAQFSTAGKLVVIAMMVRGRHRGLPYGLDRAIILPSERQLRQEAADADERLARRMSHLSVTRPTGRTMSKDRGNLLTSLLHPGPPRPPAHASPSHDPLARRMSDPLADESGAYVVNMVTRRAKTQSFSKRT